uniref:Pollen-specific protein SF3 n=1 Tax=Rhizophora mucronata TaxID=61149 RepID=A0A2P2JJA9_RHIMU
MERDLKNNIGNLIYLQLSNYNSFEGVLYCKPHFDQLFKRTGSLDKSFEGKGRNILYGTQHSSITLVCIPLVFSFLYS